MLVSYAAIHWFTVLLHNILQKIKGGGGGLFLEVLYGEALNF